MGTISNETFAEIGRTGSQWGKEVGAYLLHMATRDETENFAATGAMFIEIGMHLMKMSARRPAS